MQLLLVLLLLIPVVPVADLSQVVRSGPSCALLVDPRDERCGMVELLV